MLKIQVLGKGMIPRGYGLAPRLEPFSADFTLITTIMRTPGLSVNMLHPETGRVIPLTNQNVKRMYDTYANYNSTSNAAPATSPTVPNNAPVNNTPPVQVPPVPQTAPAPENKSESPVSPVKEPEKKEPAKVIPPINTKNESKADVKEEKNDSASDGKPAADQKTTSFKPIIADDHKNK